MSPVQALKLDLVEALSLSRDALHIYIGIGVYLFGWFLFKKWQRSFILILPVLAVAFLLEGIDVWDNYAELGRGRYLASVHDILNTLVPVLILVLIQKYGHSSKVEKR